MYIILESEEEKRARVNRLNAQKRRCRIGAVRYKPEKFFKWTPSIPGTRPLPDKADYPLQWWQNPVCAAS